MEGRARGWEVRLEGGKNGEVGRCGWMWVWDRVAEGTGGGYVCMGGWSRGDGGGTYVGRCLVNTICTVQCGKCENTHRQTRYFTTVSGCGRRREERRMRAYEDHRMRQVSQPANQPASDLTLYVHTTLYQTDTYIPTS